MGTTAQALFFDDCRPGVDVRVGPRDVLQADIAEFARLTGDVNPVHLDPDVARRTVFRGCVAHGMFVQSVAAGLMWQSGLFEGTVIAVQDVRSKFTAPLRPDDAFSVRLTVAAVDPEPAPKRGWVLWSVEGRNQRDEVVLESEWRVLMARRK